VNIAQQLKKAAMVIRAGGVIAYPTEGVYGLGCDPFSKAAVERILTLKKRNITKGLIIIGANWQQLQSLTKPISISQAKKVLQASQPTTWLFPASAIVPKWIRGDANQIAVRITDHPVAKALCRLAGILVSTSANVSTQASAFSAAAVKAIFGEKLVMIIDAPVGDLKKSTPIIDVVTNEIIRG
jgi:L-threonylcarbamoyladenylate synthase